LRLVVGITGASGIVYALRLIDYLSRTDHEIHVIVTESAKEVSKYECCEPDELIAFIKSRTENVWNESDFSSPLASSSFIIDGVAVVPCSLKTLSDVASSRQESLVVRTVNNALRLRKKVVLLIRETPLSTLDIINMLKASLAGAIIMPASPGFYGKVEAPEDFIDFIVGKLLDSLEIENNLYVRWGSSTTPGKSLCARLFDLECP
jgi:4-hydroxy-3-polyprenylbenzoate decarboxylase